MRQHDLAVVSRCVFALRKSPAALGIHTQDAEEVCRHLGATNVFSSAASRDVERPRQIGGHIIERLVVPFHLEEAGRRAAPLSLGLARRHLPDLNKLIRLFERQWPEYNPVHYAEDGCAGAYSQREGND